MLQLVYLVLIRSAGCILFELAALKRPFDGLSLMDVMYKVTEVDPPSWPAAYAADLAALFTRLFLSKMFFFGRNCHFTCQRQQLVTAFTNEILQKLA